jgi:hypothetical protein
VILLINLVWLTYSYILFIKLRLNQLAWFKIPFFDILLPNARGPLTAFNETQPLGIVVMPTTFKDEKTSTSTRPIQVCPSVYNCILGMPTLASLGAVPQ